MKYARHILDYLWSLFGICIGYIWIRIEYVPGMDGIFMECAWNMCGMESVMHMHRICVQYVRLMYGVCMESVWNHVG